MFFHIHKTKAHILFTALETPPEGNGKLLGGGDLCYPYPSFLEAGIVKTKA
jgi:hypothetical protein